MNILFNSDCYNQIEKLIEQGIKVDCIITDPPYDISTTNGGGTINKEYYNIAKERIENEQRICF